MYKTIKVKLNPDLHQVASLLAYEKVFHEGIIHVADQVFAQPWDTQFQSIQFDDMINVHNRWYLYQLGIKLNKANSMDKKMLYSRSSTWGQRGFRIAKDKLCLRFGNSDDSCDMFINMQSEHRKLYGIRKNKMLRLDISHDGDLWWAGFLVEQES